MYLAFNFYSSANLDRFVLAVKVHCSYLLHCKMKRANLWSQKMGPKRVSPEWYSFRGQFSLTEMGLFWYQFWGLNWYPSKSSRFSSTLGHFSSSSNNEIKLKLKFSNIYSVISKLLYSFLAKNNEAYLLTMYHNNVYSNICNIHLPT